MYKECSKQDLDNIKLKKVICSDFLNVEGNLYKKTIYPPIYWIYPKKTDNSIVKFSVRKFFPQKLAADSRFFYATQYNDAVAFAKHICPIDGQIEFTGFIETL